MAKYKLEFKGYMTIDSDEATSFERAESIAEGFVSGMDDDINNSEMGSLDKFNFTKIEEI